jgi:LmbE family N-acetylglucosaminyl deacetylase
VAKLLKSGAWPTPALVPIGRDHDRKRRAIWCYASQIPPLQQDHTLTERLDANTPEQFWRLAPPPQGWEGLVDDI